MSMASAVADSTILLNDQPVPTHLQKLLLDTYFICVFNSSLIFHRPTFEREWSDGRLPQHALLATCAFATKYGMNSSYLKLANRQ